MDYGYIYYVKNEVNGMMYIGKITSQTLTTNKNYKGSGVDLQKAFEEYDTRSFSIHFLAAAQSSEELTFLEKYYLIYYKIPNEKFYNKSLATSSSEQSNYYNKNNTLGVNLKDIICYNYKDNSQIVFNNITQFCKDHGFSRGCVFNVMSGQRVSHKNCIFWYKDCPPSSDAINWIINYKNKTNYKTKYFRIDEVKAELKKCYDTANNKGGDFKFNGYYIEDNKELTIDWDELESNYQKLTLRDGEASKEEERIDDLKIDTEKDNKFEQERDTEYMLDDGVKRLYFNYDECNLLTALYPDINLRLLKQALRRGQKTVMNKKYKISYRGV